jgi:putative hydroxymethylpyrimidine transport system substrate-binding protein
MKSSGEFGDQDEEVWKVTAAWMKKAGLLSREANLDGIFVNVKE